MVLKLNRPESALLTTREAASFLSLSEKTLVMDRHKAARKGAALQFPYIKFGTTVRYRRSDLEALIDANRVE